MDENSNIRPRSDRIASRQGRTQLQPVGNIVRSATSKKKGGRKPGQKDSKPRRKKGSKSTIAAGFNFQNTAKAKLEYERLYGDSRTHMLGGYRLAALFERVSTELEGVGDVRRDRFLNALANKLKLEPESEAPSTSASAGTRQPREGDSKEFDQLDPSAKRNKIADFLASIKGDFAGAAKFYFNDHPAELCELLLSVDDAVLESLPAGIQTLLRDRKGNCSHSDPEIS